MVRQWLSGLKLGSISVSKGCQPKRRRGRAGHGRRAWMLEGLEGRALLSATIYTVNSTGNGTTGTGDSGTLPYVISQANTNTNTAGSVIEFDPTVFSSSQTIILSSTLALSETAGPEVIDGPGETLLTVSGNGSVGIFSVASHVTATISGLTIADGSVATNGGGILNSGDLSISNSAITGNAAGNLGGGIANLGTATITDSDISSNSATVGGGIENDLGTLSLTGSLVLQNSASNDGGGIEDDGGTTTVSGSSIEDNTAANSGGGFDITAGTTTITASTVGYDIATAGAGIANAGTLSIANSTFADDLATNAGGGIDTTGTLTAVNVTIADNQVGSSGTGGGLEVAGGTATLDNTIVASNTAGTGSSAPASDIGGTVATSSSYNLVGTGGSGGLTGGTKGNQVGVASPDLGTPGENGGPTLTIALLQGSPAIDAGSDSISGVTVPAYDQRGAIRGPAGLNAGSTVDIGAYEASSSFLVTSAAASFDAGTLPTAIGWADFNTNDNPANLSNPVPNTIEFDTSGVFATSQTITLSAATGTLAMTNATTNATNAVAIVGPGASLLTVNGGGVVAVFSVASDVTSTISSLTISGGSAAPSGGSATSGGGIDNSGTLTVDDSTISGNSASGAGGGVENAGTLTIADSTVSGNSAAGDGGGIDNSLGTLTLINSTIAANTAASGGGISNDQTATLIAISSTIADNVAAAAGDGGGLYVGGGTASLYDTIVASNTGGTSASDITLFGGGGVSTSSASNLIGTGGSGGLTQGANGNQVGVADPGLGSLASNNVSTGGSIQTIAVLPGSPAIGAGAAKISGITIPTNDQRGVARPTSGGIDIGAFQDRGFTIGVVSGDGSQSATVDTAFAKPLAVVVTSPSGDPVQGGIVTFASSGTSASAALSAGTATIGANGQAQVTATANGQAGSYTVTASALGATSTASFSLTNTASTPIITEATVTGVSVLWGSQIAALVVPSSSGGLLVPSGRQTDLPWLGIDVLQITLSQAEPLNTSDVVLRSARGIRYQVVGLSANGDSYAVFLSRAINASDRITLVIAGADITTFTGQLNVLPGDFNDNGVVNKQDYYDVRAEKLGLGPASSYTFADINGDGVVNSKDLNLVKQRFGLKLPRETTAARTEVVLARPRLGPDVRIVRDHPGEFRRDGRNLRG